MSLYELDDELVQEFVDGNWIPGPGGLLAEAFTVILVKQRAERRKPIPFDAEATSPAPLQREAVDFALRRAMEFIDYDTHKLLECDEDTGEDTYAEHVDRFIEKYNEAAS